MKTTMKKALCVLLAAIWCLFSVPVVSAEEDVLLTLGGKTLTGNMTLADIAAVFGAPKLQTPSARSLPIMKKAAAATIIICILKPMRRVRSPAMRPSPPATPRPIAAAITIPTAAPSTTNRVVMPRITMM